MQLACWIVARKELVAIVGEGVVVKDASDLEVVGEGRTIEVSVADGGAVFERQTAGDPTKGRTWGFFRRCFLLQVQLLDNGFFSSFVAIVAFLPLALQVFDIAQASNLVVRHTVAAVETELVRMASLQDELFGLWNNGVISKEHKL